MQLYEALDVVYNETMLLNRHVQDECDRQYDAIVDTMAEEYWENRSEGQSHLSALKNVQFYPEFWRQ